MTPQPQLPGSRWFTRLRNPAVRIGVLTGLYLSIVLAGWLVIANRASWSPNVAGLRNAVAVALTGLVMLIPVLRFCRAPAQLIVSGLTAWAVLTGTYLVLGLLFERLFSRMGPLQVFMVGAAVYGICAVVAWVMSLVLATRHGPLAISRRRPY